MSKGTIIACAIAICAIFLFSRHVQAACGEGLSVFAGGWSEHLLSDGYNGTTYWNEDHKALGVQCNRWSVHRFKNSFHKTAVGVGRDFVFHRTKRFDMGVYGGVWSGYEELGGLDLIPVASPYVETSRDKLTMRVFVNPVALIWLVGWRF